MITSIQNPKVKRVCALQQKQKDRKQEKSFVVEGKKMMEEAPEDLIEEVFVSESFMQDNKAFVDLLPAGKCEVVSDKVLKHMSTFINEQGIVSVLKQKGTELIDLKFSNTGLYIVLENIQDPGNMGTIIRTADAIDAQGVIVSTGSVDIYNPKVVRATMGAIFRVPIVVEADILHTLNYLKEQRVKVYAAHLKGKVFYDQLDYKSSTCFLIGNEGNGLTEEAAKCASAFVKIPILGQTESLNASIAAGVLMYEAIRQRRQ